MCNTQLDPGLVRMALSIVPRRTVHQHFNRHSEPVLGRDGPSHRKDVYPQTTRNLQAIDGQSVTVRITSDDDNSGVSRVQISSSEDFALFSEFTATDNTTDIPWTLQPSGVVYVRAVDRAGNLSQVNSNHGQVQYRVHLPIVMRAGH